MTTRIIRKRNCQPSEIQENLEDLTLLWLDSNIDDSCDSLHTLSQLDELSNCVLLYTDCDLCINYIQTITQEKILLIISGKIWQSFGPQIHSFKTIIAIFIFCNEQTAHNPILYTYSKVIGIFTNQQDLLKSIRKSKRIVLKQTFGFSLFEHQKQKSTRDVSKDFGSFTCFQLLIDILKKIPQSEGAKRDMLDKCREQYTSNALEMKKIEQFEQEYTKDKAIEWYTRDLFVYRLVNKALRTEDVELLYLFRFFIIDLCSQLEQEWKQAYSEKADVFNVYRGQRMSAEEFDQLNGSVGSLISTNGFFSTTRDIEVALEFLSPSSDDQKTVLFEIKADYRLRTVIFADIDEFSQMEGEQEVLFNLGSVFKINDVSFDSKFGCWKIQMTATDEGSGNIQDYLNAKRKQIDAIHSPTVLFGRLLFLELGQINTAEKYFRMLLRTLPSEHEDFSSVCNNFGNIHYGKNQVNLAFKYFVQANIFRRQRLHSQHPQIAGSLFNIGCVLHVKGRHQNASDCFQKALSIMNHSYDEHHVKAIITNGIGLLYRDKKEYKTALKYFNRAIEIYQRLLPRPHPDIASFLGNIGLVHEDLSDYDQALVCYRCVFEMDEKILPSAHPNLIDDFNRIIDVLQKKGEYANALKFCQKILIEQRYKGDKGNLLVAHILKNMGDVVPDAIESIQYCQQALVLFEQLLNPTDFTIIYCLIDLSLLYWSCGLFHDALQYQLKAWSKQQQLLPAEHPEIAFTLENIGRIYFNLQRWHDAVTYFRKALHILELNLKTHCMDIKGIQRLIGLAEQQVAKIRNSVINVNKLYVGIHVRKEITAIQVGTELAANTLSCSFTEKRKSKINRKKKRCKIQ